MTAPEPKQALAEPRQTSPELKQNVSKRIALIAASAVLLAVVAVAAIGLANGWFANAALWQTTQDGLAVDAGDGGQTVVAATATGSGLAGAALDGAAPESAAAAGDPAAEAAAGSSSGGGAGGAGGAGTGASGAGSGSTGGTGGGSDAGHTPSAPANPNVPGTTAPPPQTPEPPASITVSVYVDSSRAMRFGYPASLASKQVSLNAGASVYDALRATGVALGGSSSYVSSIGGLSERSFGMSGSGWLYYVDGVSPAISCGDYRLSGGESIKWVYTLDFGNDV